MKKFSLILTIAIFNIAFAMLLIYKQNKIVNLLYEIQQLQEERDQLLMKQKKLGVELQKESQLTIIDTFAKEQLKMKPINIKEAKTITTKK